MKIVIPANIHEFSYHFTRSGYKLYLVGGAVRNFALNIQPKDWDFATDATPDQVMRIFKKVIPTGIDHGTVTVLFKQQSYEVTTLRIDGDYTDNRRPDVVTFTSLIQEDLARRDFTINAMAYCIDSTSFHDPFGGLADIDKKLIRTVGNPDLRFQEDSLRIMRGARLSSQLGFSLEEKTKNSMKALSSNLHNVSAERYRDELQKIITSANPCLGLVCCKEISAFNYWLPEFLETNDSLFYHLIGTLDVLQKVPGHFPLYVLLAGLFHDIAKPRCLTISDQGDIHFPRHDQIGSEMTRQILERLKFPKKIIEKSCYLISQHMFDHRLYQNPSAMRRFLSNHGYETTKELISLRIADIQSKNSKPTIAIEEVLLFADEIENQHKTYKNNFTLKDLHINGKDLIQILGIKSGKLIGVILDELLESVIDDPELNSKEKLLDISIKIYKNKYEHYMKNHD